MNRPDDRLIPWQELHIYTPYGERLDSDDDQHLKLEVLNELSSGQYPLGLWLDDPTDTPAFGMTARHHIADTGLRECLMMQLGKWLPRPEDIDWFGMPGVIPLNEDQF